ncbi:crossover junction endodeoxyribonuclease RuvC [Mycobacterium sp. TJFP1]
MIIVGLDPSLTSAGIAVLRDGKPVLLTSLGHASQGKSFQHRSRRIVSQCRAIINAIAGQGEHAPEWITAAGLPADLVVIEEPAWQLNMPSAHDRAGLWWGLYSALATRRIPIAVVNPRTRAKWATGNGNSGKKEVTEAVKDTWNPWRSRIRNDDIADALTLAEMGARQYGEPLHFEPRRRHIEALVDINWPEGVKA